MRLVYIYTKHNRTRRKREVLGSLRCCVVLCWPLLDLVQTRYIVFLTLFFFNGNRDIKCNNPIREFLIVLAKWIRPKKLKTTSALWFLLCFYEAFFFLGKCFNGICVILIFELVKLWSKIQIPFSFDSNSMEKKSVLTFSFLLCHFGSFLQEV